MKVNTQPIAINNGSFFARSNITVSGCSGLQQQAYVKPSSNALVVRADLDVYVFPLYKYSNMGAYCLLAFPNASRHSLQVATMVT
jgi:hypothetical protein